MSKRLLVLLIIVAVVVAATGVLWAAQMTKPETPAKPEAMMKPAEVTPQADFDRCTTTCNLLMDNYTKKYATMKAHEGDMQCWNTCWSRYGTAGQAKVTAMDKKDLWMKNRADRQRANQCSQACWRVFHDNENTVSVGGWRSAPRGVVCTP